MRTAGVNLVLGIVCLVAAVGLGNAVLGPELGLEHTTGVADDVNETNEKAGEEIEGSVTQQGEFNPLGAAGHVTQFLSMLPKLPEILVNLGIHPSVASFLGSPGTLIGLVTLLAIVLRFRL